MMSHTAYMAHSRADKMYGPRPHRNSDGRWMNWWISRGRLTLGADHDSQLRRISWRRVL